MGEAHGRIQVDAEAPAVWRWVTDPAHFPDFVDGWVRGGAVSPNTTGVGAEYEWTGALGPIHLDAHERVVEWRDGERVEYEGTLAGIPFRSSMAVEPARERRSRLEARIEWNVPVAFGGALLDRLMRPIVQADLDSSLERAAAAFAAGRAEPGVPTRTDVVHLYRKRAPRYNVATHLYWLVGFPIESMRRRVAEALELKPGDTVVEIGCGTGANFPRLQERVGPSGRIIGVDLTDRMLDQARRRVESNGWRNVELVLSDAATYDFPEKVNGILSTLALTLCREYDDVIARGAQALAPGGRWAIFDLQEPEGVPEWLVRAGVALAAPYGVMRELTVRRPWESLRHHMPRTWKEDAYFGFAYLAVGEKESMPARCGAA